MYNYQLWYFKSWLELFVILYDYWADFAPLHYNVRLRFLHFFFASASSIYFIFITIRTMCASPWLYRIVSIAFCCSKIGLSPLSASAPHLISRSKFLYLYFSSLCASRRRVCRWLLRRLYALASWPIALIIILLRWLCRRLFRRSRHFTLAAGPGEPVLLPLYRFRANY